MTTTTTKTAVTNTGKMKLYRKQLKSITNKLMEMAKTSGRKDYTANQLLRECYQLTTEKLKTFDQWKAENCSVRKGQHAYLFWGLPVDTPDGKHYCPVEFLFAQCQVEPRTITN